MRNLRKCVHCFFLSCSKILDFMNSNQVYCSVEKPEEVKEQTNQGSDFS